MFAFDLQNMSPDGSCFNVKPALPAPSLAGRISA